MNILIGVLRRCSELRSYILQPVNSGNDYTICGQRAEFMIMTGESSVARGFVYTRHVVFIQRLQERSRAQQ